MLNAPKVLNSPETNFEQGIFYRVVDGKLQQVDAKQNDENIQEVLMSKHSKIKHYLNEYRLHILIITLVIGGILLILTALLSLLPFLYGESSKFELDDYEKADNVSIRDGNTSTMVESSLVLSWPDTWTSSANLDTHHSITANNETASEEEALLNNSSEPPRRTSSRIHLTTTTTTSVVSSTTTTQRRRSRTRTTKSGATRPLKAKSEPSSQNIATTSTTTKANCVSPKLRMSGAVGPFQSNWSQCGGAHHRFNSYFPAHLSVEDATFFGYPVHQLVVCNNAVAVLRCARGQLVNINSVYYGIQSHTLSKCVALTDQTPSFCFNINTYRRVAQSCQAKESCALPVTTNNLGEPCFGFPKQLVLQYQCVDAPVLEAMKKACAPFSTTLEPICKPLAGGNGRHHERTWCEPSSMAIECARGQLIRILCGFYGIDPNHACAGSFRSGAEPTYCYANSSYDKLVAECSGKRRCVLSGEPDFVNGAGFANPCPGYAKILLVQWECVDEATYQVSPPNGLATSPTPPNPLPICTTSYHRDGSCPQRHHLSPHVPTFVANSTAGSLDYALHQQIVCHGARLVLTCPAGLLVHIYAAYYGVQHHTAVKQCQTTSPATSSTTSKMCFFADTLAKVEAACEAQHSCLLEASVNKFGDPCPHSAFKQLLVQYQCMEAGELAALRADCAQSSAERQHIPFECAVREGANDTGRLLERTWCDGSTMSIECGGAAERIEVQCAFYGLHTALTSCNIQNLANPPICYMQSSFEIVARLCNGNASCAIHDFTATFVDPCVGYDKALYVQWTCT